MVRIRSSWLPLYARNPQTFVESILWAKPSHYRKATQTIWRSPKHASFIELTVVRRTRR